MIEIERKFLVAGDEWRKSVVSSASITQGYVSKSSGRSVRVRVVDEHALVTVKIGKDVLARHEFEFGLPLDQATTLLSLLASDEVVQKTRHLVPLAESLAFEIDEFHGDLDGLILAEIELREAGQSFPRPSWVGDEVTHNPAYLNENLASWRPRQSG